MTQVAPSSFCQSTVFKGVSYALLGYACFALSDTTSKWLTSNGYSLFQVLFFNGLFGSLSMLAYRRLYPGGRSFFGTPKIKLHLIRSFLLVTTGLAITYALPRMPLVDFYGILFLMPIFVCAMSAFILKEEIRWVRWSTIMMAFCGVLIMVRPTGDVGPVLPMLAALWAAFSYALGMIMVKIIGQEKNKARMSFLPHLLLLPIAIIGLYAYGFQMPSLAHLSLFVIGGCAVGSGLLFVSLAYDTTKASTVAPFEYSLAIWGVIIGYLVFKDIPSFYVVMGGIIVIAAGLFILYREQYILKHGR